LIDGLGSSSHVARQVIGQEDLVDYSRRKSPFQDIVDQFGVSVGSGIARYVTESRFELR
ncbi:MAG: S49 family peptidase, partial [Marinobacter sp.]|nr:S49 family peptidase [Marinobacter sp.]